MAVLFGPQNISQAYGVRTLARVPLAGGARRDLLDGVVDADWIPGTNELAVIRDLGGPALDSGVPDAGPSFMKRAQRGRCAFRLTGRRVAFFEGPVLFAVHPEAMITVSTGPVTSQPSPGTGRSRSGVGPSGREVWFTATDAASGALADAVSLSGRGTRFNARRTGWCCTTSRATAVSC